MMLLGFIMLVVGFVLPFVMVLRIVEPTLFLNFFAYLVSLFGLIIGFVGVVQYGTLHRKDKD